MQNKDKKFQFAFSLEILNHLGRGLYRSFATVIAEAVSNSWDAEATEVKVTLDKKILIVEDNGKGMNDEDFQKKFLTVGYSRRLDKDNRTRRNVIGRKGIGKLAMLSLSEKVTIISKKNGAEITGGKINNPKLDAKIKKEGRYTLENLSNSEKKNLFGRRKKTGTKIIFENIKTNLSSEEIIRKYLATQFNFIFSLRKNDSFKIFVNDKEITIKDLRELYDNTQFVWFLNKKDEETTYRYKNLDEYKIIKDTSFKFNEENIEIRGFIASVKEPKNLLLRGSGGDFKASINLFCNGRLRQENLFEEITSKRITEEYLYGEIHVDGFEDEKNDRFTSSREGIIKDDLLYQKFLQELKNIQTVILADWSPWRRKYKDEDDIEDNSLPKYQKRLEDSQNWREKDFLKKIDENIDNKIIKNSLKERLKNLSYKNTQIYQDLFILENIFREYIKIKKIKESSFDQNNIEENEIIKHISDIRSSRKKDEERHALKGRIVKDEDYLNYVDIYYLGEIIDTLINKVQLDKKRYRKELTSDIKEIQPVRNPVMHTNEITDDVLKWDKIKNVIDYIERLKDKNKK
jgi:hypothetical protein